MRWPGRIPAGRAVDEPAITMDLTATFLAAAGASPPKGYVLDGADLLPAVRGEARLPERALCWRIQRSNRQMRAIRMGDWKYLDDGGTMDLLFDLRRDIGERQNLVFQHPDKVASLKAELARWEAEMDASPRTFVVR
jgi:arylsulfatase A-like enzyme